jgi:hypothetical protein
MSKSIVPGASDSLVLTWEMQSIRYAAREQLLVMTFLEQSITSFSYSITSQQYRCRSVARPSLENGGEAAAVLVSPPMTTESAVDPFVAFAATDFRFGSQRRTIVELCSSDTLAVEEEVVVLRLEAQQVTDTFGTLVIESPEGESTADLELLQFAIDTRDGKTAPVVASYDGPLLAQSLSLTSGFTTTLYLTITRPIELLRRDLKLRLSWMTYKCLPPAMARDSEIDVAPGTVYVGEATSIFYSSQTVCPVFSSLLVLVDTDGANEVSITYTSSNVVVAAVQESSSERLCGVHAVNSVTSGQPIEVTGDVLWLCVQVPYASVQRGYVTGIFVVTAVDYPLSGGAIAGIVIGVLVGVALICCLLFYFVAARSNRIRESTTFASTSTPMTFQQTPIFTSRPAENMTQLPIYSHQASAPSAPAMHATTMTIGGMPVNYVVEPSDNELKV